jgi:organic radical activating enzyme
MKLSKLIDKPEIFLSIQGEGRNLGQLSVFVRTSLCNLHCVWCDTDYTWNWEGTPFKHVRDADPNYKKYRKEDQILELEPSEIAKLVHAYGCRNVVLTGGEPLMQQDEISSLMEILRRKDASYRFEIETNATLVPSERFDALIDQYNASPKLPSSGNEDQLRLRPKALAFFAASPKTWFKFVCCNAADVDEVVEFTETHVIKRSRVFLMPQGTTSEHIWKISSEIVPSCIERGFNFTDRLHVHLFRNKRGT